MAAQRYAYARDDDNGDAQGGDDATKWKVMDDMAVTTSTTMEMATTEEGDRARNAVPVTEEGDTATAVPTVTDDETETAANESGTELTDETVTELGSIAKVRMAVRRSRREAKQQRVRPARKKAHGKANNGDEVARVVAEMRVEAGDGLPTTMMLVVDATQCVEIDSGARYSVAGTDWMASGERKSMDAPVAYIEGIGGFLLYVLGVWTFDMINAYDQAVTIDACIIDGYTDDFWWASIFSKDTEPPWISTVARYDTRIITKE
ncbi:unnamed protein product [Phytophthora fragariaefolia]|uniref:Unnamed protein product n=1 Tax=Phytophthora fragariaefolia TaxID=1490495 RepID=A0A9W6XF35_9STRA|nr:unnamed protein product [Phytophthora fragariaefolia]